MTVRSTRVALALTVAMLLSACDGGTDFEPIGGDQEPSDPAEPADEPEPEPEPEPEDPFAVPDEIDVAYAQRVFDELFRIEGDAFRIAYDRREDSEFVPNDALDLLRSVSSDDDYFARRAAAVQAELDDDFGQRRIPLADRPFEVEELTRADGSCIVADGDVDFRVTSEDPARDVVPHSYALHRDEDANATGWVFASGTAVLDEFEPLDPEEVCP